MKKLVLMIFLLGIVGAAAYGAYLYFMAPQRVFCTRLVQLCEIGGEKPIDTCNEALKAAAESEPDAIREAASCAIEADSCTGAAGCLVGAGATVGLRELGPMLKNAPSLVDDFLKGIKKGAGELFD